LVLRRTFFVYVRESSDHFASAPATRSQAPTSNIDTTVLSALALFALAIATLFTTSLRVHRRLAQTRARDPEWRASTSSDFGDWDGAFVGALPRSHGVDRESVGGGAIGECVVVPIVSA